MTSETLENIMAAVFDKILSGEKISQNIGSWSINAWDGDFIHLEYNPGFSLFATYQFSIELTNNHITFNNYHRKTTKGAGTLSLQELEKAFQTLAKIRELPVQILFNTFGQKDTEKWLQKNNYVLNSNSIYIKQFGS